MNNRFTCIDEKPNGNYDICSVCFWEDDPMQSDKPDYEGGANHVSLNQARKNFLEFGSCEREMIVHIRKPKVEELTGID